MEIQQSRPLKFNFLLAGHRVWQTSGWCPALWWWYHWIKNRSLLLMNLQEKFWVHSEMKKKTTLENNTSPSRNQSLQLKHRSRAGSCCPRSNQTALKVSSYPCKTSDCHHNLLHLRINSSGKRINMLLLSVGCKWWRYPFGKQKLPNKQQPCALVSYSKTELGVTSV